MTIADRKRLMEPSARVRAEIVETRRIAVLHARARVSELQERVGEIAARITRSTELDGNWTVGLAEVERAASELRRILTRDEELKWVLRELDR